ncbi:hypothetical protein VSS37_00005 [Candidatus Thiothrix sp. Deng01]|uniref:Uncharacterized protein n=1 Tax=Candidatus Thiothrix phosphatis TaxID=3112415 RepID=A0ABU6CR70_9GAMM|nr:hypothetical protein [Candidatus Thiothrix sp. Deng01]MEB4589351.1 hypothetical protein [Candidatus Thiothrix sp. Deng01]
MCKQMIPLAIVREMEVSKSVGGVWHVWAGDDVQVTRHGDALQFLRYGRLDSEWLIPATGERRQTINRLFAELAERRQHKPTQQLWTPPQGKAA